MCIIIYLNFYGAKQRNYVKKIGLKKKVVSIAQKHICVDIKNL